MNNTAAGAKLQYEIAMRALPSNAARARVGNVFARSLLKYGKTHRQLTSLGIPCRKNGNKLGLRKRFMLLEGLVL